MQQHTVSGFLLKYFAFGQQKNSKLYQLTADSIIHDSSENLCTSRNFYDGEKCSLESYYSQVESKAGRIIQRVNTTERLDLTEVELAHLLWFIALQRTRTETFRNSYVVFLTELTEKILKISESARATYPTLSHTKDHLLQQAIQGAELTYCYLMKRQWCLLLADKKNHFICSNHPFGITENGRSLDWRIVTFPLSYKTALISIPKLNTADAIITIEPTICDIEHIAVVNTLTEAGSSCVFSPKRNFVSLDFDFD